MPTATREITVQAPAVTAYQMWRNLEGLPDFMEGLIEVRELSDTRSHWRARGPLGVPVEWDADLVLDEPGRRLAWTSVPESEVRTEGSVEFVPAGGATIVHVDLRYEPPAGAAGEAVATVFANPATQLQDDLRRFKLIMESGREFAGLETRQQGLRQGKRDQVVSIEHGTPGGTLGAPTPHELGSDQSMHAEKGEASSLGEVLGKDAL
jgi:uncharacterized membrane protein